jgi:hypothetical protein
MNKRSDSNGWENLVRGVNEPPEVPRERMWQAIDAARQDRRQVVTAPEFQRPRRHRNRFWQAGAALAAVLVLGVAIGRMTVTPDAPVVAVQEAPVPTALARSTVNASAENDVNRLAVANLFGRADYLLTDFKVSACAQQDLGAAPRWAGGLLMQTRLLLDTPVAKDPEMQQLLEELELVLAQIVGLSRDNCARDMAWIKQGLQDRSTLDRLRIVTAGGNQGAL